jgi:hypothetical protein
MAARGKQAKKAAGSAAATTTPWVQRFVEDDELRDNFRVAFEAAKDAFDRVSEGKGPRALVDDKKVQKDLRQAADALKEAGSSLKDGPRKHKPKKRRLGRRLVLLIVGAGIALAVSEDLRTKVLDALFGKEEEFEYSSTTTPSSPPEGSAA